MHVDKSGMKPLALIQIDANINNNILAHLGIRFSAHLATSFSCPNFNNIFSELIQRGNIIRDHVNCSITARCEITPYLKRLPAPKDCALRVCVAVSNPTNCAYPTKLQYEIPKPAAASCVSPRWPTNIKVTIGTRISERILKKIGQENFKIDFASSLKFFGNSFFNEFEPWQHGMVFLAFAYNIKLVILGRHITKSVVQRRREIKEITFSVKKFSGCL